jgi:ubiquitin
LKKAIEYPEVYDVNISQKEYEDFRRDLLTLAYSEESEEDKEFKFNLNEYEKYTKKESSSDSRNNFIPYNLLYSIYPRIAYPEDKEKVNVLMIQQPSITSPEKYKMYKHYFSTTNYTDVFPDLPEPYQCLL